MSFTTVALPTAAPRRVLAFGAWLKNAAGLLEGDRFVLSPNHGDLGTPEACGALDRSIEQLATQAGGPVDAVAHDLHPDFYSTHLAHRWAARLGVPAYAVQHHHAHIAVVQAEAGLGDVIGLALDGVGLGSDGTSCGGELLRCSATGFERLDHLPPLLLPGGDIAAREPWRMAAAVMTTLGQRDQIEPRFAPVVGEQAARIVATLLGRGLNCSVTTSAGRWFDAAAGVLGLSVRQAEEAEAALALERAATVWLDTHPAPDRPPQADLDLRPLFADLLALPAAAQAQGAARFHIALAQGLVAEARAAATRHGLTHVVLGGGCFFNRLLSQRVTTGLEAAGLQVHRPTALSCGDGGLALGQAWVAAHRRGRST
jgi:hydrogenase maturation protein HypF